MPLLGDPREPGGEMRMLPPLLVIGPGEEESTRPLGRTDARKGTGSARTGRLAGRRRGWRSGDGGVRGVLRDIGERGRNDGGVER